MRSAWSGGRGRGRKEVGMSEDAGMAGLTREMQKNSTFVRAFL